MADAAQPREPWQTVVEESIFHLLEVLICQEPDPRSRDHNIRVLRQENQIMGHLFERIAEILKERVPERRELERLLPREREAYLAERGRAES